jgi:type III restriction enzyme
MSPSFFDRPILNSPADYPARHWELDETGQPTNRIIERRRLRSMLYPAGWTRHVRFTTSKELRWQTDPRRCHINWIGHRRVMPLS